MNTLDKEENKFSNKKEEALKLSGYILLSTFLGKILSMPSSLVVAKELGAEDFGLLALILTIVQYMSYTNFGLLNNMTREIPIAYGRGNIKDANLLRNVIGTNYIFTTILSILIVILFFQLNVIIGSNFSFIDVLFICFITISANFNSFIYTNLKAEGKFIVYGKNDLILKSITPIITIIFAIFWGLYGVLSASIITNFISAFLAFILGGRFNFNFNFNLTKTKQLLSTGIMMYINKILDGVFMSVGLIITSKYLGVTAAGIFSFAFAISSIRKVPFLTSFIITIQRDIMFQGGKYGVEDKSVFINYFKKPFILYLIVNCIFLGLLILFYDVACKIYIKEFRSSVELMIILFIGLNFYNLRYFIYSYFDVTKQMNKRFGIVVLSLIFLILSALISVFMELNLKGIMVSVSFSLLLISIQSFFIAFTQIFENRSYVINYFLKILIVVGLNVITLLIFTHYDLFDLGGNLTSSIIRGGVQFLFYSLFFSLISFITISYLFAEYNIKDEVFIILKYSFNKMKSKLKFIF